MTDKRKKLPSRLMTIKEVSEILHVHPNTVRHWSDNGLLKAYRVGRRGDRRFRPEDIEALLVTQ